MITNVSLLFYLKKPKNHISPQVPIYLRITVSKKRAELATGRACEPGRWNSSAGRASGTKETIKSLNAYLDALQLKVYEAQRQLLESAEPITAESIKRKLTGKGEKAVWLAGIFEEHNQKMAALVGEEFTSGTLELYTTLSETHPGISFLEIPGNGYRHPADRPCLYHGF